MLKLKNKHNLYKDNIGYVAEVDTSGISNCNKANNL